MNLKKLKELTANIGDMALKRRVEKIITDLNIKPTDTILDCGCGDGLYLKTIRELGDYKIFGFDLNGDSLRLTQKNVNDKPVPLVQGNGSALPYNNNSFDKIFSTEVLEHIPNDLEALNEIYRVLKPGGKFIITVPNHNYPLLWDPINWLMEAAAGSYIKSGFLAGIWNMHLRLYYSEEIKDAVKKAGFVIKNTEPMTHYCVPLNHIILYGLKLLLDSGILPENVRNSADKFSVKEKKQSGFVKFGYYILNLLDSPNNNLPKNKSSVSLFIEAFKKSARQT